VRQQLDGEDLLVEAGLLHQLLQEVQANVHGGHPFYYNFDQFARVALIS
jgi:hypothetical protein